MGRIEVYRDVDPNNPEDLREIHLGTVFVENDGSLKLTIVDPEAPGVSELQEAIREIGSHRKLELGGEEEHVIDGTKALVLTRFDVEPGDTRYIWAVSDLLQGKHKFDTEVFR